MKQVASFAVVAALSVACGGAHESSRAAEGPAVPVRAAAAEMQEIAERIEVGGAVKSRTVAVLTSRIVGQLREIAVLPGARVRRGALLAVLDGREMDANRDRAEAMLAAATQSQAAAEAERTAAEAGLKLAAATHARVARLRERQSATAQEFDEAQAALSGAEARATGAAAAAMAARSNVAGARSAMEGARIAAAYSRILAPFDGVVTERHLDEGTMTMPGTPVVTMEESGEFEVEVRLDEARAARVDWKESPRVTLAAADGTDVTVTGRVVERAVALDAAHTVVIKVALPPDAELRTGMFARVALGGARRRALTVPADALVARGQLDAVFVVDGDRAKYRVIEAGQRTDDNVEVRAGLAAGERVVRGAPPALADGTRVTTAAAPARSSK